MTSVIAPESCTIIKVHGRNDEYKMMNDFLFTLLLKESNMELKMKTKCCGIVNFKCKIGDEVKQNDVLCVLNPCPHDIVVFGMCGLCSKSIEITNSGNGNIKCNTGSRMAMVHANKDLVVNENTAMKLALRDSLSLLKKRKLCLLIDLDLTILHTTSSPVASNLEDVYHYTITDERNRQATVNYHTKMRPFLKQFLENMHKKFELHIYTFGNRSYADTIREFIDPEKILFGQRIISRDDSFDMQKKTANLKSLFPRGDNMVCIMDDRPEVWSHVPNFIHVKPYTYFPDTGDINTPGEKIRDSSLRGLNNYPPKNPAKEPSKDSKDSNETNGSSKTTSDCDTTENTSENLASLPDEDDYLLTLENILTEIHTRFYSQYDVHIADHSPNDIIEKKLLPDVKVIMNEMRSEVLRGTRICFSGLVARNQMVHDTQAYQILKNLGANYDSLVSLPSLDKEESTKSGHYTTHLICHSDNNDRTDKMKQVCQYIKDMNNIITTSPDKLSSPVHRVSMVNIYWLWHCYFLWSRIDEGQFLLSPSVEQMAPPQGVTERCYADQSSTSNIGKGSKKRPLVQESGDQCSPAAKRDRQSKAEEDQCMSDLDLDDDKSVNDDGDSVDSGSESTFDEEEWLRGTVFGPPLTENENGEAVSMTGRKMEVDDVSLAINNDDDSSDGEKKDRAPAMNWEEDDDDNEDAKDGSSDDNGGCDYGMFDDDEEEDCGEGADDRASDDSCGF